MRKKPNKVFYITSNTSNVSSDKVLIDHDEKIDSVFIKKLALKLMSKTLRKEEIKRLHYQQSSFSASVFSGDVATFYSLDNSVVINVMYETLHSTTEVLQMTVVEYADKRYLSCELPADAKDVSWCIEHIDHAPFQYRSCLEFYKTNNSSYTKDIAFFQSELPFGIDIERLEILGLHNDLLKRSNMSKKIAAENLGIFHDEPTFERDLHLIELEADLTLIWFEIK